MDSFEGYVGIRLWDGQLIDDLKFITLFAMLILFALVYHAHFRLFTKMLKDVFYTKRQTLFEAPVSNPIGREWFFRIFMTFQVLFLCSICLFAIARDGSYIKYGRDTEIVIYIGLIFMILLGYYWLKQCFYYLLGLVFTDIGMFKIWKKSYNAVMGTWGVSLYVPVIWFVFVGSYTIIPITLFVILYILCRFAVIYKTIRIFHIKNNVFLYISLYLCGQEILPFVFLYKGIVYLYNFIEVSALWH